MLITLSNDFHRTQVTLRVVELGRPLSKNQIRRARQTLCGHDGCLCGGVLGERGEQPVEIILELEESEKIVLEDPRR